MGEERLWRIYLLGGFRVAFGSSVVADEAWRRRKAGALLKLLALAHGHRLHREQAMEALWPDQTPAAAANSLYQVVHAARAALASVHEQGAACLQFERERLCLCPDLPLWIDAEAFDAAAQAARRSTEPATYQAALALYTGDLLPEDLYEDWVGARRTALRLTYLELLTSLARLYEARGELAHAIETLQRVLAADPADEAVHRSLMRLHAAAGDRPRALRQYQALADALRRELDAEPDAASQALYRELAAGRGVEVAPPGPASASPTIPPAPPRRDNLPRFLTSFIGRENETAEVARLLEEARLLTLTGAGGCGKTRLALVVARELLETYPAGAWWADLAPLAEPTLLPRAVASAVQAPELPGQPLMETLVNYLGDKRLLLILDNCEHLIQACAELVEALLAACPNLTILTTSREPLAVSGEVAWWVPPLALPDLSRLPPLAELAGCAAVRLFCERAAAVATGFALTAENAPAVAETCVQLDGMPLAIELAAARARVLTAQQIAGGLADRFGLLTAGSRTASPRHKTLRAALDWSYDLLSEAERILFRRLAVFRGGFTLAAVEAVCEGNLDLLAQLVDKSLVTTRTQGAEARYALLKTIQQYAAEQAAARGELAQVQDRHLLYYLALAEEIEPRLKSREREAWFEVLEGELGNLRAALAWAAGGHGRADAGLRLAGALYFFWYWHNHLQEGRQWLDKVLASAPAEPAHAVPRALALCHAAVLTGLLTGDGATSCRLAQESVALARAAGPPARAVLATALSVLAHHTTSLGDAARGYGEESVALARAGDNPWDLGSALFMYGQLCYATGDVSGAARAFGESLELTRGLDDRWCASMVLDHIGRLALAQGDYITARRHFEAGVTLKRQFGSRLELAYSLGYLGQVALAEGAYTEDAALLDECIEIFRDLGVILPFANTMRHRGIVAVHLGDTAGAARLLKESLSILRRMDNVEGLLGCLVGYADLALAQEQLPRGARLLAAITALRQTAGCNWHDHLAARIAYARAMESVQPMMAQPECAAAWAAGQAMTLDEAVAYALEE